MRILLIPLIVLLNLTGCAGGKRMTAEDYRLGALASADTEKESLHVNRAFESVVATFQRKAPECLDRTVKTTSRSTGQEIISTWNPTFIVGAGKAELHIQRIYDKGMAKADNEPEQGHFVMVVDIKPTSIKSSRIDIYRSTQEAEPILKAVKSWATGKDIICPDLTRS